MAAEGVGHRASREPTAVTRLTTDRRAADRRDTLLGRRVPTRGEVVVVAAEGVGHRPTLVTRDPAEVAATVVLSAHHRLPTHGDEILARVGAALPATTGHTGEIALGGSRGREGGQEAEGRSEAGECQGPHLRGSFLRRPCLAACQDRTGS